MKTLKMSLAASLAVAASLSFTGCELTDTVSNGGSSTTAAAATKTLPPFQGSVVGTIATKGLTFKFDDNTTCFNNRELTITTGINFNVSTADFNASASTACSKDIPNENFSTILNRAAATIKDSNKTLAQKYGPGQFLGHTTVPFVNIDTTVQIQDGVAPTAVAALDLNDVKYEAIKVQMQLDTLKNGGTTPANSRLSNTERTALAAITSVEDINQSMLPANIRVAEVLVTTQALADNTGVDFEDLNTTQITAAATAAAAEYDDLNTTEATNTATSLNTDITDAATAAAKPLLNVNSIDLSIGSNSWSGATNNFSITKAADQNVSTSDNVVLTLSSTLDNNFSVSGATLKAIVTDGDDTLTMMLDGVSYDSTGATIAANSNLSLVSTYANIGSYTGTVDSEIKTTDLSFSLDTLAAAVSNSATITTVKEEIVTALSTANTYTVTVGVSGIDTNASNTNLEDVNSTLGTGFIGYTGTVIVK